MAKICRVIQIQLNQSAKKMSIWSLITDNVTVTNIYRSVYLQDGGKKSISIDKEQNYVTVTLCRAGVGFLETGQLAPSPPVRGFGEPYKLP